MPHPNFPPVDPRWCAEIPSIALDQEHPDVRPFVHVGEWDDRTVAACITTGPYEEGAVQGDPADLVTPSGDVQIQVRQPVRGYESIDILLSRATPTICRSLSIPNGCYISGGMGRNGNGEQVSLLGFAVVGSSREIEENIPMADGREYRGHYTNRGLLVASYRALLRFHAATTWTGQTRELRQLTDQAQRPAGVH
jgi:hypothetical protein